MGKRTAVRDTPCQASDTVFFSRFRSQCRNVLFWANLGKLWAKMLKHPETSWVSGFFDGLLTCENRENETIWSLIGCSHNPKVVGSNPAPATKNNRLNWENSSGVFLCQGSKTGDRVGIRVGIRAHASIPVKSSAWKPFLSGGNFLQLCGSELILCKTGDRSTPDVLAALKGRVLLWAGRYLQTRAAI